jgi:hypothetical protein
LPDISNFKFQISNFKPLKRLAIALLAEGVHSNKTSLDCAVPARPRGTARTRCLPVSIGA